MNKLFQKCFVFKPSPISLLCSFLHLLPVMKELIIHWLSQKSQLMEHVSFKRLTWQFNNEISERVILLEERNKHRPDKLGNGQLEFRIGSNWERLKIILASELNNRAGRCRWLDEAARIYFAIYRLNIYVISRKFINYKREHINEWK